MRILLLLILFFISHECLSQGAFFKMYGGLEHDYGHDIVQLADSGYLIAGTSGSFRVGHADAFLLKVDKNGVYEWSVPYGGAENDGANDMAYVPGVGVYLVGRSNSWSENHDLDVYVAYVDLNGNLQWEKTFPGEGWQEAVEAARAPDNGVLLGINKLGGQTNAQDISLLRLDALGDTVWNIDYSLPGDDEITCIESYQDSLFLVSSNRVDTTTSFSMAHLMMIHDDGNVLWEDTLIYGAGEYLINDFFVINDTLVGIGGYKHYETDPMDMAYFRYKVDPINNYSVATVSMHNNSEWYGDVITNYTDSPNRRYSAHRAEDWWTTGGGPDVFFGRNAYNLGWEVGIGALEYEGYNQMFEGIPTLDGGAVMIGYASGGDGGTSVAIFKVGPGEDYPDTDVEVVVDQLVGLEGGQDLNSSIIVYPNPATTKIKVESLGVAVDSYELLTTNGTVLKSDNLLKSGEISLDDLSSGIYFVRLLNDDVELGVFRVFVH